MYIKNVLNIIILSTILISTGFGAGFHYPYEIWNGSFNPGKYTIPDNLTVGDTILVDQVRSYEFCNFEGGDCLNSSTFGSVVSSTGSANYIPIFNTSTLVSNSLIYQNGSNIGIGTNSPESKLHVYSGTGDTAIIIDGSASGNPYLQFRQANSGVAYVQWNNTGSLLEYYSGGDYFFNGGNVGIGDSTPDGTLKLDIEGQVGATEYCDENGDNCVLPSTLNSSISGSGTANHIPIWSTSSSLANSTIYQDGSNVGIGTSIPIYILDVYNSGGNSNLRVHTDSGNGDLILDGSSGGNVYFRINGTTESQIYGDSSYNLRFFTNSSERLRIDNSGYVGIGSTSPEDNLHVSGAGAGITLEGTSAGDNAFLTLKNDGGTSNRITTKRSEASNSGDLELTTANDITLMPTGSVGIGLQSPSSTYKLDVAGSIRSAAAAPGLTLQESDAGSQQWSIFGLGGNLAFRDVTNGTYPLTIEATTPSNTVYLDNNGRVGIGTTSPSSLLDINGITSSEIGVEIISDPSNGTTHTQLLSGFSKIDRGFRMISEQLNGARPFYLTYNLKYDGSNFTQGSWGGSSAIKFESSKIKFFIDGQDSAGSESIITPTEVLTIESSGDVGIGDTAPDGTLKLDVEGQVGATEYCDQDGNNCANATTLGTSVNGNGTTNYVTKWLDSNTVTDSNIFDNGTHMGIGTTSPTSVLEIDGTFNATAGGSTLSVESNGDVVILI